ncbi:PPE domain-containing protein [Mycobacterium kansasii]
MYWGIPPEVNAFRLLSAGAGPGAHIPQVASFETAAATHLEQGVQMATTAAATSGGFVGVGGAAMMAKAMPMAAWLNAAGAHAQKAAATVQAGVDGYLSAAAATVAHPIVIANRVREATLQATNIIGQNTPAIIEANIEYTEFWAQNAGAMMGYLAMVSSLLPALSVPLPPSPLGANPAGMAAGVAAVAAQGAATGVQGLSAGLSEATTGVATAAQTGMGVAAGAASAAASGGQAGQQGAAADAGAAGPPAGAAQGELDAQMLGQAQAMAGPLMSAPSILTGAAAPLSSAGQLPQMLTGQLGGLMGPMMSAATGGLGGGPGTLSSAGSGAGGSPWSGLGGANGGYAGGGSGVSAALTKPSAGSGLAGPVGLPAAWWSGPAADGRLDDKPLAGARGGVGPVGAMGPGMYGMPAAAAARGRQSEASDAGEADKSIVVPGIGEGVPVITDDGVVYTEGQGV